MSEAALEIRDLTKVYEDDANETVILDHVNIAVERNEFLCILGPSGCGKSTLLRCIAGFEKYEGEIRANGSIRRSPGIDRYMVFQDFNQLFPWKTVEKNVQYPLRMAKKGYTKEQAARIAEEALDKVGLKGYGRYYPHQLSGGMKQRTAIAKALALRSEIILMDEPFAALDAMTRGGLQEEVARISREAQATVIFITHNIQEAIILGSRILVFGQKGEILLDERNTLPKPVTPSTPGYGQLWERLHRALYEGVAAGEA